MNLESKANCLNALRHKYSIHFVSKGKGECAIALEHVNFQVKSIENHDSPTDKNNYLIMYKIENNF